MECKKCLHEWFPRTANRPKKCPSCGTKFWNAPKRSACAYCNACPTHGKATATPDAQTTLDRFKAIEVPDDDAGILAALKGETT